MTWLWQPSTQDVWGAIFMFFVTLVVGGGFFYALWFELRTRMWFRHFERDTVTTSAEIFAVTECADESIRGSVVIHYRFMDANGTPYEGSARLAKSALLSSSERALQHLQVGDRIKVHYYTKFPSHFSFLEEQKNTFKRDSRVIGFFIFCWIVFWWVLT